MKKILFIDNWSQGKRFFSPVVNEFSKHNYICIYLHADSYYLNNKFKNVKPTIDTTYEDHDIHEFSSSLLRAFVKIKPDIIVFISIHGIFHRWANFVANYLNIPCFFFMHGIRLSSPRKTTKKNFLYKLDRANFYNKQFILFIKDYFKINGFNFSTFNFTFKYYKEFIFDNYNYTNKPSISLGFNYKIMFVNIMNDVNYFKNNYPLSPDTNFVISGNVSALESAIKSLDYNLKKDCVLFVSQPGIVEINKYVKFILLLKTMFDDTEFNFIFRPHPRDSVELLSEIEENKITISYESDVFDYARSCAAIGINSAMLIGFMFLRTPIFQISDNSNPEISSMFNYTRIIKTEIDTNLNPNLLINKLRNLLDADIERDNSKTPSIIIFENIENYIKNKL